MREKKEKFDPSKKLHNKLLLNTISQIPQRTVIETAFRRLLPFYTACI